MKSIKIGDKEICMVTNPDVEFYQYAVLTLPESGLCWLHFLDEKGRDVAPQIDLHGGRWLLLGRGSEIDWKQFCTIYTMQEVDLSMNKIGEEELNYWIEKYHGYTPEEAAKKFLTSHGYKKETTIVLIKE